MEENHNFSNPISLFEKLFKKIIKEKGFEITSEHIQGVRIFDEFENVIKLRIWFGGNLKLKVVVKKNGEILNVVGFGLGGLRLSETGEVEPEWKIFFRIYNKYGK